MEAVEKARPVIDQNARFLDRLNLDEGLGSIMKGKDAFKPLY